MYINLVGKKTTYFAKYHLKYIEFWKRQIIKLEKKFRKSVLKMS